MHFLRIKIWNVTSGILIRTLIGHTSSVESLAVLDNGLLLSGSNDKTIKLWRVETADANSTIANSSMRFKFNLFYYCGFLYILKFYCECVWFTGYFM